MSDTGEYKECEWCSRTRSGPERDVLQRFTGRRELLPETPLGRGFLTGDIRSLNDLDADDWRRTNHRFADGNLRIVDEVRAVAAEIDTTPAQVALSWLLAQGDDIAPIPGTKRVARLEENAADHIELTAGHVARLNVLPPAAGERYDADNMAAIDR